ncbi:MAG: tetratricopeptide repeat protein [Bacteroidetes bacterium]|nr:tetratricopeptide repeat protein [Bacteroidota bacterium]
MNKIRYYYILLATLLTLSTHKVYSTETETDSIAETLYVKVDSLLRLQQYDEMYIQAKNLLAYAMDKDLNHYLGDSYKHIGAYFLSIKNLDSAYFYYNKSASYYAICGDSLKEGKVYIIIGYRYYENDNYNEAINYYRKGLKKIKNTDDHFWKGLTNENIGFILFEQSDYYHALKHYQDAIPEFLAIEAYENVGRIYDKIGITYRKTKDKVKEEEAYMLAINYLEKIDTTVSLGMTYNNLSEMYLDNGKTDEGLELLEKAKKVYISLDYQLGLCGYYSVLAYYYAELDPPDNENVIKYCNLSIPIAEEYGDFRQYADATAYAGEAYLRIKQPTSALSILKKGYKAANEHNFKHEKLKLSHILSVTYKELNNPVQALKYLEIHTELNDSILNEEKMKEFTQLDMSFKFHQEQIKDSIHQLQLDQEVKYKHEKELLAQKQAKLIFVFTTALIILIAVFIFIYARRNKKQAVILNEKNILINKSLEEKELLLKEIHHRVKNSLQLVSSLLELQSKDIHDEKALESIHEGQERVRAIALIHQKLYQNENLTNIDFNEYTTLLTNEIKGIYPVTRGVNIEIDIVDMHFDIDTAIPLGLILNELITNAFKYAFSDKKGNRLSITIKEKNEDTYILTIRDSGKGLQTDFDLSNTSSLGLRLVKRLAKQLHGSLNYKCQNGCVFQIVFKDTNQRRMSE